MRLDARLVAAGKVTSRSRAADLIKRGLVTLDGKRLKASDKVTTTDFDRLDISDHRWVSRAGLVKQGLVAMLGPIFDTLIMCTSTALLIIISGVWLDIGPGVEGVKLTAEAFSVLLGPVGYAILLICVVSFGASTIFTYSFYGSACAQFLFGRKGVKIYQWVIIFFVVVFAVIPVKTAIAVIDLSFAFMAIPTLISSVWLAPKVIEKAREYFATLESETSSIKA